MSLADPAIEIATTQIIEEMRRQGLDRDTLEDKADVGRASMRGYEQGWRRPGLGHLTKLADALGCELDIVVIPKAEHTESEAGNG